MAVGRVKWFSNGKGYGFIEVEGDTEDIFVHYSDIVGGDGFRSLEEGAAVAFEVDSQDKSARARKVTLQVEGDEPAEGAPAPAEDSVAEATNHEADEADEADDDEEAEEEEEPRHESSDR